MNPGWLILAMVMATEPKLTLDAERALAIDREVVRITHQQTLWPGFDPLSTPLAVFDGRRTYLFRHPAPPDGFSPLPDADPPAYVFEGRHPAVTSNSSAEIGGRVTATLRADAAVEQSPTEKAAVALHEAFHVFQRAQHRGWQANEGDLLLYPAEQARLLGLRRMETESFRRALGARDSAALCRSAAAIQYRRERFAVMDSTFSKYEWRSELNEGLAQYIQERAMDHVSVAIPESGYAPAQVRHRSYGIGAAMALLLDRWDPNWKSRLEADDRQCLHDLLASVLAARGAQSCPLSAAEVGSIEARADRDAAAVASARTQRRTAFDAAPGWRLEVVAAAGAPLWPQGFDPLNVERVDGGLLHTRFLKLGNDAGEMSVVDDASADLESFTEGAGDHPLFQGVRRVVVVLPRSPTVEESAGHVSVHAPGLTARFQGARIRSEGNTIRVELATPP